MIALRCLGGTAAHNAENNAIHFNNYCLCVSLLYRPDRRSVAGWAVGYDLDWYGQRITSIEKYIFYENNGHTELARHRYHKYRPDLQ